MKLIRYLGEVMVAGTNARYRKLLGAPIVPARELKAREVELEEVDLERLRDLVDGREKGEL